MAEIDIARADGVILFNGEPVADLRKNVPASILEAFYALAETRSSDATGLEGTIETLEEEAGALESKLRQIRDLCDE